MGSEKLLQISPLSAETNRNYIFLKSNGILFVSQEMVYQFTSHESKSLLLLLSVGKKQHLCFIFFFFCIKWQAAKEFNTFPIELHTSLTPVSVSYIFIKIADILTLNTYTYIHVWYIYILLLIKSPFVVTKRLKYVEYCSQIFSINVIHIFTKQTRFFFSNTSFRGLV